MAQSNFQGPFQVLGLPYDATESVIRARYLELVKRYPPDREPEHFRKIQAAYESARDPLLLAQQMLEMPAEGRPQWDELIEKQTENPPVISVPFLLSLGNREAVKQDGADDE